MIALRPAAARGTTRSDGLDSRHTFSFGHYHDPAHMGFGVLRVLNEDRLTPGAGEDPQRRANMEILTWVLDGALECGGVDDGVLQAGQWQCLSAGSGMECSHRNASATAPVHFLQVWIQPDRLNARPACEQRAFGSPPPGGALQLVAAADGRDGALRIGQNVRVYAARLAAGDDIEQKLSANRRGWLQLAAGAADIGATLAAAGDGVAISGETRLRIRARCDTQLLLLDLP